MATTNRPAPAPASQPQSPPPHARAASKCEPVIPLSPVPKTPPTRAALIREIIDLVDSPTNHTHALYEAHAAATAAGARVKSEKREPEPVFAEEEDEPAASPHASVDGCRQCAPALREAHSSSADHSAAPTGSLTHASRTAPPPTLAQPAARPPERVETAHGASLPSCSPVCQIDFVRADTTPASQDDDANLNIPAPSHPSEDLARSPRMSCQLPPPARAQAPARHSSPQPGPEAPEQYRVSQQFNASGSGQGVVSSNTKQACALAAKEQTPTLAPKLKNMNPTAPESSGMLKRAPNPAQMNSSQVAVDPAEKVKRGPQPLASRHTNPNPEDKSIFESPSNNMQSSPTCRTNKSPPPSSPSLVTSGIALLTGHQHTPFSQHSKTQQNPPVANEAGNYKPDLTASRLIQGGHIAGEDTKQSAIINSVETLSPLGATTDNTCTKETFVVVHGMHQGKQSKVCKTAKKESVILEDVDVALSALAASLQPKLAVSQLTSLPIAMANAGTSIVFSAENRAHGRQLEPNKQEASLATVSGNAQVNYEASPRNGPTSPAPLPPVDDAQEEACGFDSAMAIEPSIRKKRAATESSLPESPHGFNVQKLTAPPILAMQTSMTISDAMAANTRPARSKDLGPLQAPRQAAFNSTIPASAVHSVVATTCAFPTSRCSSPIVSTPAPIHLVTARSPSTCMASARMSPPVPIGHNPVVPTPLMVASCMNTEGQTPLPHVQHMLPAGQVTSASNSVNGHARTTAAARGLPAGGATPRHYTGALGQTSTLPPGNVPVSTQILPTRAYSNAPLRTSTSSPYRMKMSATLPPQTPATAASAMNMHLRTPANAIAPGAGIANAMYLGGMRNGSLPSQAPAAPCPQFANPSNNSSPPLQSVSCRQAAGPPRRCYKCNTRSSTLWRTGPDGYQTLCNQCGLQYEYHDMVVYADTETGRVSAAMFAGARRSRVIGFRRKGCFTDEPLEMHGSWMGSRRPYRQLNKPIVIPLEELRRTQSNAPRTNNDRQVVGQNEHNEEPRRTQSNAPRTSNDRQAALPNEKNEESRRTQSDAPRMNNDRHVAGPNENIEGPRRTQRDAPRTSNDRQVVDSNENNGLSNGKSIVVQPAKPPTENVHNLGRGANAASGSGTEVARGGLVLSDSEMCDMPEVAAATKEEVEESKEDEESEEDEDELDELEVGEKCAVEKDVCKLSSEDSEMSMPFSRFVHKRGRGEVKVERCESRTGQRSVRKKEEAIIDIDAMGGGVEAIDVDVTVRSGDDVCAIDVDEDGDVMIVEECEIRDAHQDTRSGQSRRRSGRSGSKGSGYGEGGGRVKIEIRGPGGLYRRRPGEGRVRMKDEVEDVDVEPGWNRRSIVRRRKLGHGTYTHAVDERSGRGSRRWGELDRGTIGDLAEEVGSPCSGGKGNFDRFEGKRSRRERESWEKRKRRREDYPGTGVGKWRREKTKWQVRSSGNERTEENGELYAVKAVFGSEMHRLTISRKIGYAELQRKMCEVFQLSEEVCLEYRDNEDDYIAISTESDMAELFGVVDTYGLNPIRVRLLERVGPR